MTPSSSAIRTGPYDKVAVTAGGHYRPLPTPNKFTEFSV